MTLEYLNTLKPGGYLEQFSFPAVTAFFQDNIAAEYLDELKKNGLLEITPFMIS